MKLLVLFSILASQMLWSIGSIEIKNVSINYLKGSGTAEFDKLSLGLGSLTIDVAHLHKIDMSYEGGAYKLIERFDNNTSAQLKWATGTDFLQDKDNKIAIKTEQPIQFNLGTKKTYINVPELRFATAESYMRFEGLNVDCSNPKGQFDPTDFIFHVIKACLNKGQFNLAKMYQMSLVALSDADYSFLNSLGYDLSERTKFLKKDLESIRHIDISIDKNQIYANLDLKFGPFAPKLELMGVISILERQKQLKVHISQIKLADIALTDLLFKLIENYKSEIIKIQYPYVYIDITGLLSESN